MVVLLVSCFTPGGLYRECSLSGHTIESCLDRLSDLVRSGWRLLSMKLVDEGTSIYLPVNAIDGQPVASSMHALQQQWEDCLLIP